MIVHENRDILTHNSRRYFVVCTFNSNVHLLTASVAVPKHLLRKYFDRLKEKEVRLSTQNAISSNLEVKIGNTSRVERFIPKNKNNWVISHLRNSRMLTEDAKAKLVGTSIEKDAHFWFNSLLVTLGLVVLALLSLSAWLICSTRRTRQT